MTARRALGVDRGHQAPLAGQSGTPFASDTNLLSNITPQGAALNQGAWQRLEARENELATKAGIAVYVLTGPLFERVLPPLPRADAHRACDKRGISFIATLPHGRPIRADGRGSGG